MPHVNNIFNIKVNEVSENGSINFGNTIHKGHVANEKRIGGQNTVGDCNGTSQIEKNFVPDPDLIDVQLKNKI
jgi:hypothetical protein